MSFAHKMPFGAEVLGDGKISFRFWALNSSSVDVALDPKKLPMNRLSGGWFELAAKARDGRRAEFACFTQFSSEQVQGTIPGPNDRESFLRSKLDWPSVSAPTHAEWLQFYIGLWKCRRINIVPRLPGIQPGKASYRKLGRNAIPVVWPLRDTGRLALFANFGDERLPVTRFPAGSLIYTTAGDLAALRETRAYRRFRWCGF